MSIYKKVLDSEFQRLHLRLQERYLEMGKASFVGHGIMERISGTPNYVWVLLGRLGVKRKLLFPESGEKIRFFIKNTPVVGPKGEEQIHWERVFFFEHQKRYFNALMSLEKNHSYIKDYLGEPPLLYSDLLFNVEVDGSLTIQSNKQRLVFGKVEIPLPSFLQGKAMVKEGFCDVRKVFTIDVVVRNPIIGNIFSYKGEFTNDESS